MIRTLLCDLGNVLIHVDEDRKSKQLGDVLGLTAEDARELLANDKLQWRYESGLIGTEDFFAALHAAAKRVCTPAEIIHAFCDIFTPVAGMAALIEKLAGRGVRLVLVSNTSAAHLSQARRVFPCLARFDAFVLSYEVRAMKPEPAYYRHVGLAADCRHDQALFVDDLAANIAGAAQAGFLTHQFLGVDRLVSVLRSGGVHLGDR